jgi:hypothetical protein
MGGVGTRTVGGRDAAYEHTGVNRDEGPVDLRSPVNAQARRDWPGPSRAADGYSRRVRVPTPASTDVEVSRNTPLVVAGLSPVAARRSRFDTPLRGYSPRTVMRNRSSRVGRSRRPYRGPLLAANRLWPAAGPRSLAALPQHRRTPGTARHPRTVGGRDAAYEPTGTYSRRVRVVPRSARRADIWSAGFSVIETCTDSAG